MEKVATFCGKPIQEMSREELIEAVNFLANENINQSKEHARRLDILTERRKKTNILSVIFPFLSNP
jgi:hypothetical protein